MSNIFLFEPRDTRLRRMFAECSTCTTLAVLRPWSPLAAVAAWKACAAYEAEWRRLRPPTRPGRVIPYPDPTKRKGRILGAA